MNEYLGWMPVLRQSVEGALRHLLTAGPLLIAFTWMMALAGAAFAYLFQSGHRPRSLRGFLRFCFPAVLLRHPSCRLDLAFSLSAKLLYPFAIAPVLLGNVAVAIAVHAALTDSFGAAATRAVPAGVWVIILLVLVVLQDLVGFLVHVVMHRSAALWEVHKTHHSAGFLVPLTNRRFHPIQVVVESLCVAAVLGAVIGTSAFALGLPLADYCIAGIDAFFLINALSFHHLRHSHIQLSYGWLERYLMSPAQHQLHHSLEVEHWDRNFGLLLSCWDRMLGTLVYSQPGEQYRLGLPEAEGSYATLAQLYVTPLRGLARIAGQSLQRRRNVPQQAPE